MGGRVLSILVLLVLMAPAPAALTLASATPLPEPDELVPAPVTQDELDSLHPKVRAHALLDGVGAQAPRSSRSSNVLPSFPLPPPSPLEQNDCASGRDASSASALLGPGPVMIELPAECSGWLDQDLDRSDEYRFTLSGDRTISAVLQMPEGVSFYFCVGRIGTIDTCGWHSESNTATVFIERPLEGEWAVKVTSSSGTGPYAATIQADDATPIPDCGLAEDMPETPENAPYLPWPVACIGSMGAPDMRDHFRVVVPEGSAATVAIHPGAFVDYDLCATASSRATWPHDCSTGPIGAKERIYLDQADEYLLDSYVYYRGRGWYGINVEAATPQDDCGTGRDGGSQYRVAIGAQTDACVATLDVPAGDRFDLYRFLVTEAGGLRATVVPHEQVDVDVCLYPPGWSLPVACGLADDIGAPEMVSFMTTHPGAWLIGVFTAGELRTSYALSVSTYDPAPQDDCAAGEDAPDLYGTTPTLAPGTDCRGSLDPSEGDWRDRYLMATPSGVLHVRITFDTPIQAALCRSYWHYTNSCDFAEDGVITLDYPVRQDWDVWFVLETFGESSGYRLEFTWSPAHDDCGTGADAPDSAYAPPARLTLPAIRCEGEIERRFDSIDRYTFHANEGDTIHIAFETLWPTTNASGYSLELETPSGATICCYQPIFGVLPITENLIAEPGDYTLIVRVGGTVGGPQPYLMTVIVK